MNKRGGEFLGIKMKTSINLTLKYWRKHKMNAAALLFSGVLLTAVIFVMLMSARESVVRDFHRWCDLDGNYDVLIANSDDETLAKATEGRSGYNYGVMYVYGKMGIDDNRFEYATIEDKHNIWHAPLEEGRMPKTADEIAVDRGVLNKLYWPGKCGDTITLDGRTFTVVGIIDEEYGKQRAYTAFVPFPIDLGKAAPYKVPLIFVGESDEAPLYRIDLINNFFDIRQRREKFNGEKRVFIRYLRETLGETQWYMYGDDWDRLDLYNARHTGFFMAIAWVGAAVSVLSVFSVLRNIFTERRGKIEMLKKIGMKKSDVGKLYAVEAAILAAIQTLLGILAGLAAYGGIFLFKTNVLGEKPYSGFTSNVIIRQHMRDPFLYAALISAVITAAAYVINALTINFKQKAPSKDRKPRSLFRCFGRVFRNGGATVVQTAALTLICFSVLVGYMFFVDNENGKLTNSSSHYFVGGFDMAEENIAEYYSCSPPSLTLLAKNDNKPMLGFPIISADYTKGFDDETARQLPEYALATGCLEQTLLETPEYCGYFNEGVRLPDDTDLKALSGTLDEQQENFLDGVTNNTLNIYRVFTKLVPSRTMSGLSEYVTEGAIDLEALNSGKEILIAYRSQKPPFEVGDTITISSVSNTEDFKINDIASAEVKIGAFLQIPADIGAVKYYTLCDKNKCNFITTAAGARAMGMHGAAYTQVYSSDKMNGGIFPSSAEMRSQTLAKMKWEELKNKIVKAGGLLMTLIIMSLLGFASYFNGIGMKIRIRSYEISIFRAIGTPVSELRRRLLISSIKIPLAASTLAYGLTKTAQFVMKKVYEHTLFLYELAKDDDGTITTVIIDGVKIQDPLLDKIDSLKKMFFLDYHMWEVNTELPALILLMILCTITFTLTAIALKKFKRDIAGDLNQGRTRQ